MVKTLPSNAGGVASIPGWGAKIPHALGPKNQNIKQKQYCNKLNKDVKNGPHQKTFKKKKRRHKTNLGLDLALHLVPKCNKIALHFFFNFSIYNQCCILQFVAFWVA